MREAGTRGARIVHFPEGAICFPDKLVLSVDGPDAVGPADWDRCQWPVLQSEPAAIAALARELRLWTVIASAHRLTGQHRPHNSLYVISDRGDVVTRYDERLLSKTKVSYLYSPGISPVTFDIDGVRFGCLIGMEIHYPELFAEYEKLDVDCVLLSTTGVSPGAASRRRATPRSTATGSASRCPRSTAPPRRQESSHPTATGLSGAPRTARHPWRGEPRRQLRSRRRIGDPRACLAP